MRICERDIYIFPFIYFPFPYLFLKLLKDQEQIGRRLGRKKRGKVKKKKKKLKAERRGKKGRTGVTYNQLFFVFIILLTATDYKMQVVSATSLNQ